MAELDLKTLARALTRLHHSGRGTGEGEDWYKVPVSLMNQALAALERIPELELKLDCANAAIGNALDDDRESRDRAERVEAAAREAVALCDRNRPTMAAAILRNALAGAAAPEEVKPCPTCDGCGQVADTDDQEPWTAWANLPPGSDAAVRMGLVRPIPCPVCAAPAEGEVKP